MKVKNKQTIVICCISLLLLFASGFNEKLFAAIQSTMYAINDINSLEEFYDQSNEYTRRYILRYLPDWFEAKELECAPECVSDMIYDALYSHDGLVVREAVRLTGRYAMTENADRLIELYKSSHRTYNVDGSHIRESVISSFYGIGGDDAKNAIEQFLYTTPRYYLENEFSALLKAVAEFGDTTHIDELDAIKAMIEDKISNYTPKSDMDRTVYRLEAVMQLVNAAREEILNRGGE